MDSESNFTTLEGRNMKQHADEKNQIQMFLSAPPMRYRSTSDLAGFEVGDLIISRRKLAELIELCINDPELLRAITQNN